MILIFLKQKIKNLVAYEKGNIVKASMQKSLLINFFYRNFSRKIFVLFEGSRAIFSRNSK